MDDLVPDRFRRWAADVLSSRTSMTVRVERDGQTLAFEPIFTTKGPGAGTCLGLATVQDIVKQHRGRMLCASQVGTGTTFSVHLPRADGQVAAAVLGQAPAQLHGNERILLVEDDLAPTNPRPHFEPPWPGPEHGAWRRWLTQSAGCL